MAAAEQYPDTFSYGGYTTFTVMKHDTAAHLRRPHYARSSTNPGYNATALEIATGMRTIHQGTGIDIGAIDLAAEIAAKNGVFYVARAQVNKGPNRMIGYAYIDVSTQRPGLALQVDELEAVVDETDTTMDACRRGRVLGALVSCALRDGAPPAIVKIMGREAINETRPADFFTNLGLQPGGPQWGEPGSYMFGQVDPFLENVRALLAE